MRLTIFLLWAILFPALEHIQCEGVSSALAAPQTSTLPNLVGKPAPNFVVKALDGKEISLRDYRGRALVVNFWATWCGACKLEMPWLAQLREQYANRGFEVLGIVTDDAAPQTVATVTRKYGVKYPILECNHKTAQAYGGLSYLPASFFVDRKGKIIAEMADAESKQELEVEIRKALMEAP